MSDLSIRKALGLRLEQALPDFQSQGRIWWPNKTFSTEGKAEWLRFSFHPTGKNPVGIGRSREEQRGFVKVGCNVAVGIGEDRLNELAQTVEEAYPLDLRISRAGINIDIVRRTTGGAFADGGFYYAPVNIYWVVWRAT